VSNDSAACAGLVEGSVCSGSAATGAGSVGSTNRRYSAAAVAPLQQTDPMRGCAAKNVAKSLTTRLLRSMAASRLPWRRAGGDDVPQRDAAALQAGETRGVIRRSVHARHGRHDAPEHVAREAVVLLQLQRARARQAAQHEHAGVRGRDRREAADGSHAHEWM
jgi:hypothetical protein